MLRTGVQKKRRKGNELTQKLVYCGITLLFDKLDVKE